MLVFLIAGAVAGLLLGTRFKVLVIVPASLLAAIIVFVIVNSSGHESGAVVLTLLATLAALQIGYVVGSILQASIRAHLPGAEHNKRDSFAFKRFFRN